MEHEVEVANRFIMTRVIRPIADSEPEQDYGDWEEDEEEWEDEEDDGWDDYEPDDEDWSGPRAPGRRDRSDPEWEDRPKDADKKDRTRRRERERDDEGDW